MRAIVALSVLSVAVVPALGDAVTYTFDVVSGVATVDMSPDGMMSPDPVTVAQDGTFAITVYASNGHIGESDTFVLEDCDIYNSETLTVTSLGLMTANLGPSSGHLLDFAPVAPGHIGAGGQGAISADVYMDFFVIITGVIDSWFQTHFWVGEPSDFLVTFTTSGSQSDVLEVSLEGMLGYEVWMTTGSGKQTMTLDITIDIVGTAHVVPDPALGGLTALGLGLAGAWLRRRPERRSR